MDLYGLLERILNHNFFNKTILPQHFSNFKIFLLFKMDKLRSSDLIQNLLDEKSEKYKSPYKFAISTQQIESEIVSKNSRRGGNNSADELDGISDKYNNKRVTRGSPSSLPHTKKLTTSFHDALVESVWKCSLKLLFIEIKIFLFSLFVLWN